MRLIIAGAFLALALVASTVLVAAVLDDSGPGLEQQGVTQDTPALATTCAHPAGWRRLANRVQAPVYCPSWLPDPLTSEIDGRWNNIDSVSPDRSYLMGFVWQEGTLGNVQELHVNLRGYPGNARIPTCQDVTTVDGTTYRKKIACFQDPRGSVRSAKGIVATRYTVNHGADSWHVLLAWRRNGSLYTVSQHVAPPLTYAKVVANLKRIFDGLVLVPPR